MSGPVPPLDGRLVLVADAVRQGARLCDVGCDHGRLICTLALAGRIPGGVACDIRPGPLSQARELVARCALAGRIDVRLCDGLSAVSPGEVDDIAVAGMGGETIAAIVLAAGWLRDGGKRLILQPQTRAPYLRGALCAAGFALEAERAAWAGRFVYSAMTFCYAGVPRGLSPLERHTGALAGDPSPAARAYLLREARRLRAASEGILHASGGDPQEAGRLSGLAGAIESLLWEKGEGN